MKSFRRAIALGVALSAVFALTAASQATAKPTGTIELKEVKAGKTTKLDWDVPPYGRAATKVKPKITLRDDGHGRVSGEIISKPQFTCGVPDPVTLYKLRGAKPDPSRDRKFGTKASEGSDDGPFFFFDGLKIGIKVYAVYLKSDDCKRAKSNVIKTTKKGGSRGTASARTQARWRVHPG